MDSNGNFGYGYGLGILVVELSQNSTFQVSGLS